VVAAACPSLFCPAEDSSFRFAAPGGFRAEEAVQLDAYHVVVAEQDGSHVAEAAQPDAPVEAERCVASPSAIAAVVAVGSLADALVVQVSSAEFPAGDYFQALLAESPEDGYSRAALVVALADDCSPAACPGTAEAAAQGQRRKAGGERCDCWAQEHCDSPVRLDGRSRARRCDFPEEQADSQERRAEENSHSHWDDRERYYSERHCSDHQGAAHSGFRERQGVGHCSAVLDDSPERSADRHEALHRDSQVRSVVLDDSPERSAEPDDSPEHWAVLDEVMHRGSRERSVDPDDSARHLAALDDWAAHSAVRDGLRGQSDWGHHAPPVAMVEPEPAVRRELFSPEVVQDDLLRQDRGLAD